MGRAGRAGRPGRARRARRAAVALVAALLASGCAITEDGAPRDLPLDPENEFTTEVTGDEATGVNRIYLLSQTNDQTRLRSVARGVATTPQALLESLISGPNAEELDRNLNTAIPPELEVLSESRVGFVLTIEVNDALSTLASEGLTLALAQIVATTTELDSVQRVRIRTNGENQAWPTGDGRLSAEPLSIYDYPNLIETTQPALPTLPST